MFFRIKPQDWLWACLSLLSLTLVLLLAPAQATPPHLANSPTGVTPVVASSPVQDGWEQGRALYQAGRFEEAATSWRSTVQRYQIQGDELNEALSWSYLSLAYQALSQWDLAQSAIATSLARLRAADPPADAILWAQVLNTQASLQYYIGQVESALANWQQAQQFYEAAGDSLGRLGSQINQAKAWQALGSYERSRQQLETITQTLTALPDSELKVSGLHSLGLAIYVMGDLVKSQAVLEQSLTIARQLNTKPYISSILLNLGAIAVDFNDPNQAWQYFEQAQETALQPSEALQAGLEKFNLLLAYGQVEQARSLAPQLLQALQTLPPSRSAFYGAIHFAATLNRWKNPGQILPLKAVAALMATTTQSARQLKDAQAEAYALYQWGQLYQRTGQWTEARQLTQQSLAIAYQLRVEPLIAQSAWRLGQSYRQVGQRTAAIAAYREAIKALQALRLDLVAINPEVQFSFRESVEPVYRELVGLLLDGQPSQPALVEARDLIEALKVAELDNFLRETCLGETQAIDKVDPEAAILYPIILPDRVAVILSMQGRPLRYYATPIAQTTVEQTLSQFLAGLNPVSDSQARDRAAQDIYNWLIRPAEVDRALDQAKTLVFLLDGPLRNIPIAALYDGQRYLVEKYALALSPGLQLLATQSWQATNLNAIVGGISEARSGFSALPAVTSEVQQIAQLVPSSVLLNQEFTSAALTDRIKNSQARVVHLATHGQFSSRQEDTFLLTWDGQVGIKELGNVLTSRGSQPSTAIELLVLSACDTATGDDRAILGLAGLAVKSGARSTIATLWPVKDQAAALLMTQLYKQLQQTSITKAEALRQAQIALIHKRDYRDPFFWAAFVLVGNWV